MAIYNKWLTPYQRSYQAIKSKLVESLMGIKDTNNRALITDYSEGNILIIILSLFAAIAEVLHYYIDNAARESFLATARRYESLRKHAYLVDYHPAGGVAAQVNVTLIRPITGDSIGTQITITTSMKFTDSDGNTWYPAYDVIWYSNVSKIDIPLIQHEPQTVTNVQGITIPSGGRPTIQINIADGKYYEKGTMQLTIGGESWSLVDTFAYSKPTDKHFMVDIDGNLNPYITFGDGVFGALPTPGATINKASCYVTVGANGNVPVSSITSVPSEITNSINDVECSNIQPASGGANYESFNLLKEHIALSVKTMGVAITKEDFESLAKLVPGIAKAKSDYECGRKLTVYVSGLTNVAVADSKLKEVLETLKQKAPLTTWLKVKSAGTVEIMLEITVTGKKSYKRTEIQSSILQALYDAYNPQTSDIGGHVRISDIYALIDNLPQVDYLSITKFYTKPWPVTLYGNKSLLLGQFSLAKATGSMIYFILFSSATEFTVRAIKNGNQSFRCTVGGTNSIVDQANGFQFTLPVQDNGYQAGYRYQITISEPNHDYEDPGFNVPVFQSSSQLVLTVNETL